MRDPLFNISPADGRYAEKIENLRIIFSEFGLIKKRVFVEIRWLKFLKNKLNLDIPHEKMQGLEVLEKNFSQSDAQSIKEIEKTTNHDVKAVEYYIKTFLNIPVQEFVHFGLTSEDVNNLSYALMLKEYRETVFKKSSEQILNKLVSLAGETKSDSMMARTHGQPATPTTFGKEIIFFAYRIHKKIEEINRLPLLGKLNGATGNYASFVSAYPEMDWIRLSNDFILSLGLTPNPVTIQIEPHDYMAGLFNEFSLLNTVFVDLAKDIWLYISYEYLKLRIKPGEIGSSTMPHKVNPIDFENSWGNAEFSMALFQFFSRRLPISMMQRDLTDSTLLRNIGLAFAHFEISLSSLLKGLNKIEVNREKMLRDLEHNPQLLAEPIQTVMRKNMIQGSYEKIKEITRGKSISSDQLTGFINSLDINSNDKANLKKLTPENYIGLSEKIVDSVIHAINR